MTRILVTEELSPRGLEAMAAAGHDVDVRLGLSPDELRAAVPGAEALVIRSATRVDASVLAAGRDLVVVGRAGVGLDNVDVDEATRLGVMVVNAPESNILSAAELTIALLLAQARNIPQAHAALVAGRWERSRWEGVELHGKTLGVVGLGRIGALVAQRALGFGMRLLACDPYVAAERAKRMGVELTTLEDLVARSDFITIHLPKTPETEGFIDAAAFAKMRDGVRILNVARGGLIDDAALKDALDSGKVAGAALDVFASEPMTEHPLFGYPNVVVTPHLGASTAEATDRAGYQSAEQVVAALTGGVVSTAVNIPAIAAEDMEMLGPFLPLASQLGRLAMELAEGSSVERIEAAFLGRIADFDTRLLGLAVIVGALQGRGEEQVNLVNAPTMAAQRGIVFEEKSVSEAQDFNELIRVTVVAGSQRVAVAGTGIGPNRVPHLVEVQGRRLTIELERYVTVFRYEDLPGMIGRVGTIFGTHGINISSAAVGHVPDGREDAEDRSGAHSLEGWVGQRLAAMVVTTDVAVPKAVIQEIVASDGFVNGWSVDLG